LEVGFAKQQAMRSQQSAQLPIAGFTQVGNAETGAGANCIHTTSTLNKIAVNRFTAFKLIASKRQKCKMNFRHLANEGLVFTNGRCEFANEGVVSQDVSVGYCERRCGIANESDFAKA